MLGLEHLGQHCFCRWKHVECRLAQFACNPVDRHRVCEIGSRHQDGALVDPDPGAAPCRIWYTLFAGADHSVRIARREIFGVVLG